MITNIQFKKNFFKKCPIFGPLALTAIYNLKPYCYGINKPEKTIFNLTTNLELILLFVVIGIVNAFYKGLAVVYLVGEGIFKEVSQH